MRWSAQICLVLIILTCVSPSSTAEIQAPSLELYVFTDGTVEVNYITSIESTEIYVFLELPGANYQSLLILNQDGLPLAYSLNSTGALIESLGSSSLDILYYTTSLTYKNETIWTVKLYAPVSCRVVFPAGSMIVGLNDIPLEIGTEKDNPYVVMQSGSLSVSYIQGTIDQRALAEDAVYEAENKLQVYKDQRLVIHDAETLLGLAEEALSQGDYLKAVDLAEEAIQEAERTALIAYKASEAIANATIAVQNARAGGRTHGLEEAEDLLRQGILSYEKGDYMSAQVTALQSQAKAEKAEKPRSNTLTYVTIGGALLLTGVLIYFRQYGGGKPEVEIVTDLERIYDENPNLRVDDKEVVRYIAENRGELFANEIRERFDIPRTSLWRMIRRLKEQQVLEERKVGGQSLISIHRRYRK